VGAAVYSVKAKPLILGVTGDVGDFVPFVICSSDMVILRELNSPQKVKLKKFNGLGRKYKDQWGEIILAPLTLFSCGGGPVIGARDLCHPFETTMRTQLTRE
jgi:hypothetical protein